MPYFHTEDKIRAIIAQAANEGSYVEAMAPLYYKGQEHQRVMAFTAKGITMLEPLFDIVGDYPNWEILIINMGSQIIVTFKVEA